MKIYSDEFNFLNLKVLFSGEIAGVNLNFSNPETLGKNLQLLGPKKYPLFEILPEEYLFMPNSISRYLLTKSNKYSSNILCEEWIEWENASLLPHVFNVYQTWLSGAKLSDEIKKNLTLCLQHLDSFLSSKKSFSQGADPNLADIVIWSTLFLIYNEDKLQKEFFNEFISLKNWYEHISSFDSAKNAVKHLLKGKDHKALKEILLSVSIPLPVVLKKPISISSFKPPVKPSENETDFQNSATPEEIEKALKIWQDGFKPEDILKPVNYPVLPRKGEKNVLITSALPYVNNVPHLGNLIGAVLSADVFARYSRLRQHNTLYICGTDEYGTATETKAIEERITPQEICDKYNKLHKEIYDWFNIQFDKFGRTTTPQQTEICQDIFWKLYKGGFIDSDTTEQLFCENCSRFLADRFVEGICPSCSNNDARGDQCDKCQKLVNPIELINPRCKVCNQTPRVKQSEHLFLNLPKLQPMVKEWLDKATENSHWSSTAKVISYAWLKEGLKPRCITRDLKWGTPVPLEGFKDKVFYVWFDAPIGYLSMAAVYTPQWEKWFKNPEEVQLYQFMAKDNVAFHGIIFPASELGTGDNFTVVNHLAAVEYLNYEDTKFSKSRGIGVFGNDAQSTGIPSDIFRFYLLFIRPENQDTAFSWSDLMTKNNSELLNNLGNYVNRASTFIFNNFDGKVPEITLNEEDGILLALITRELNDFVSNMDRVKLKDGIRIVLNISRLGNQHIQGNKPWELVKGNAEQKARAGSVMGLSVNIACLLSILLEPYMPVTAQELRAQLNFPMEKKVLTDYFVRYLATGHPINKPIPLFKKIEQTQMDELKKNFAGKQDSPERQVKANSPKKTLPEVSKPLDPADPAEIEALTLLVNQQGDKVRVLKSQKAEKVMIDAEVAVLLSLKKKLISLSGEESTAPTKGSKKKSKK